MNQACSIKLDRNNFLLWKSMVLPIIKGNQLENHIADNPSKPSELILDGTEIRANSAYGEWCTTDHLLMGWLFNTMTLEIASQMTHCTTAGELWKAAKDLTGATTRSTVTLYKSEFHRTRKGTMKMEEYLNRMKGISDNLTMAGCPISTDDLITQTLAGLDAEYNPIVVQLTDKIDLTWIDLQATLLTYETRMEQLNQISNLSLGPAANVIHLKQDNTVKNASHFPEPTRGGWQF